jgi:hypothetical protein
LAPALVTRPETGLTTATDRPSPDTRSACGGAGAAGIGLGDREVGLCRFIIGARCHTLRQQASLAFELAGGEGDARGRGRAIGRDLRGIAALDQRKGLAGAHGIADADHDPTDGARRARGQHRLGVGCRLDGGRSEDRRVQLAGRGGRDSDLRCGERLLRHRDRVRRLRRGGFRRGRGGGGIVRRAAPNPSAAAATRPIAAPV